MMKLTDITVARTIPASAEVATISHCQMPDTQEAYRIV
jgi:hypothetical protein